MWKELLLCVCGVTACVVWTAAAPHRANENTGRVKRPVREKRAVPAFVASAAADVGTKVVDALGDRIADGVVENHQEKVVSALEDYFSGQFDKADEELDSALARGGNLLAGVPEVESARVQLIHRRGGNTGDAFSPPNEEVLMSFDHVDDDDGEQDSSEVGGAVAYVAGIGPVMMNGCFSSNYQEGDPCYEAFVPIEACANLIDGATFLGVGFDGRGEYSTDSRKKSLVQRACEGKQGYKAYHVPDTMTVQGSYETDATVTILNSIEEYRYYLEDRSSVTSATAMFQREMEKAQGHGAGGGAFGLLWSAGGGKSSQSGSDRQTSSFQASSQASAQLSESNVETFLAIMELNIFRYEIFLDFVKPTDLNLAFLRDFLNLPTSYFSVSADREYQSFLRSWGTHYITSAKFGGQLKLIKTKEITTDITQESFALAAQADFRKLLSTYSAQQSQSKSSSWWHDQRSKKESSSSTGEANQDTSSQASSEDQAAFNQIHFSSESLEVKGGDQKIAAIITEYYTTSFGDSLREWLESIEEFPKAFEFTMQPIPNLFDMNFDGLFPNGVTDFGCFGGTTLLEDGSGRKYYNQDVKHANGTKTSTEVRYCDFATQDQFREGVTKRRMALEYATSVYFEEGPFEWSNFRIEAGEPGCETAELVLLEDSNSAAPSWQDMISGREFAVIFDMRQNIPNFVNAKASVYVRRASNNRWLTIREGYIPHLYDGFNNGNSGDITSNKISVGGLVMTYEEATGMLTLTPDDFDASSDVIPDLPAGLSGQTVARAEYKSLLEQLSNQPAGARGAMPCNMKWSNAHRIDPTNGGKCVHFTAASAGDIFVAFAGTPRKPETWLYLQISPEAVALYKAMRLQVTQFEQGAAGLGSDSLYQSYFVCVTENPQAGVTIVQYGKTPDNEEKAHVWLDHSFPSILSVQYYSFGSGTEPVKVMDVSQLGQPADTFIVCREGTVRFEGRCVQVCHEECEGCRTTGSDSPRDCIACQNYKVPFPYIDGSVGAFECVAACPSTMAAPNGTMTCQCIKRLDDITPEGVVTCVAECPLTHYEDSDVCKPCSSFCEDVSINGVRMCSGPDVDQCTSCLYKASDDSCIQGCSPGQKAVAGSSGDGVTFTCEPCRPGYRCVNGDQVDEICPAGTISSSDGTACDPCPVGTFSATAGSDTCELCQEGQFNPVSGSASCQLCLAGQSSGAGATECTPCQAGEFSDAAGSSCQQCPPGQYSDTEGADACQPCQLGQSSNTEGTACVDCEAGEFSTDGSSCQKCPAGQYSAQSGSSSCQLCPANKFSNEGATTCQQCGDSYYSQPAASTCDGCQLGNGVSYRGTVQVTVGGELCQRWDSQTPHQHPFTPTDYPSSGLDQNYCRNPDEDTGVWCHTVDPNTEWAFCDVPHCPRIRLSDTNVPYEGRVEVRPDDSADDSAVWGTVCDDSFDDTDATVICRELGYSRIIGWNSTEQGTGTEPIYMDELACGGDESSVFECSYGGWGNHDCDHTEDVVLTCDPNSYQVDYSLTFKTSDDSQYSGSPDSLTVEVFSDVCDYCASTTVSGLTDKGTEYTRPLSASNFGVPKKLRITTSGDNKLTLDWITVYNEFTRQLYRFSCPTNGCKLSTDTDEGDEQIELDVDG